MTKKTMDIILVIVGVSIVIFTIIMVWIYLVTGGIPDTLCTCFFIACTGECGFMGWIKTAKVRQQDHEWQLEQEKRQKDEITQIKEELSKMEEYDGTI